MARVKRGNVSRKRHKKVLEIAKGYRGAISKLYRPAHQVVLHSLSKMYKDRRLRKRDFRALWIQRINGALSSKGLSYSKFMGALAKNNVELNRKTLSELAIHHPETFDQVVAITQK